MSEREKLYVCPICGRTADKLVNFKDVSCASRAVLCYKDKLVFKEDVSLVESVKEGGIVKQNSNQNEEE